MNPLRQMERICFILPLAFSLILLPNAINALKVRSMPEPKGAKNPLIEKACMNAKYKDTCIKNLKSQPGSANADIKTLAFMSLNLTKDYGYDVASMVAQKLEDAELGPGMEQAFTDCNTQYTDIMAQVEDTIVAFFSNAFKDVTTWLTAAIADASSCEKALKTGNATDAMGDRNQVFIKYCSSTMTIIEEMAKGKH